MIEFDEAAGFEANLQTFLKEMETVDPEMAAVFRDAIVELSDVSDDAKRKKARQPFNSRVLSSLDAMIAAKSGEQ